ncbi:hypothetical protein DERP_006303 [Dermatophagoides pteronyssinus]|uniref:Uncharacterized protein n=1 Tax=Dermatophagoides pteronyssinus TaxID=6956 RepID=A0ABQ8IYE3_DERPT|nr:hypothetical protein DERP_006303 [Dermatophagoides pteronyssinus]
MDERILPENEIDWISSADTITENRIKEFHNTLYYLNANYLREDEHLARVITSSNAFSKSKKI